MKRWQMYYLIHSMKNQGFSKRQIAEKQGLNFRTVSKYLSMTAEEFEKKVLNKERQRNLDLYEGVITDWLKQHPDMSSAQVYDWLKEHYQVTVAERTARRYVEQLRKKYEIPKAKPPTRQYEAIEDPPMGKQMQVDIGETWVQDLYNRRRVKLYFIAAVLSHSRYKWGKWYTGPLTTAHLIQGLQTCFEYIQGIPKELVIDQDRLLAVSENYGEIIFTREFDQYRLASGFEIYLCRASDPQTKGRTEAAVKYFKGNFARNRQYLDIDTWNESFEDWLDRTGNAKEHAITKKIPAEVFMQERLFLKPAPSTNKTYETIVTRTVHKNNVIFYEGNRYTVPLGTYSPGREVSLEVEGDKLIIHDIFGDYTIAEHKISQEKGELIKNNNHRRDTSTKINALYGEINKKFGSTEESAIYLTQIRRLKPRYTRDQYALINKTLDEYEREVAQKALNYCVIHSLYSAVEFKNAAQYFASHMETEPIQNTRSGKITHLTPAAAVSKKRELSDYAQAAKGGAKK